MPELVSKPLCITKCITLPGDRLVKAVVKKWGNSYGIILPVKIVRNFELTENDVIDVQIKKKVKSIETLFGVYKTRRSAQKIKDEMRAGWDD